MPSDPHAFQFDLDQAIGVQVIESLEASLLLPLEKSIGPKEGDIYSLYHNGKLVYIGKASKEMTKSRRDLRQRLNEHINKIVKRQNIMLDEMMCRYMTFDSDWWVIAAELAIIRNYDPAWNESGFGSKFPGVGRPGTHRVID